MSLITILITILDTLVPQTAGQLAALATATVSSLGSLVVSGVGSLIPVLVANGGGYVVYKGLLADDPFNLYESWLLWLALLFHNSGYTAHIIEEFLDEFFHDIAYLFGQEPDLPKSRGFIAAHMAFFWSSLYLLPNGYHLGRFALAMQFMMFLPENAHYGFPILKFLINDVFDLEFKDGTSKHFNLTGMSYRERFKLAQKYYWQQSWARSTVPLFWVASAFTAISYTYLKWQMNTLTEIGYPLW